MKIYHGKQKVGNHQDAELVIDWEDLFRYQGRLLQVDMLERSAGNFLRGVAILCMVAFGVVVVMAGSLRRIDLLNPRSVVELLPWLGLLIFIYAQYLLRDRSQFRFNRETVALEPEMDIGDQLEIDNYLSYPLWQKLDYLYYHQNQNFLIALTESVLSTVGGEQLVERWGITRVDLQKAVQDRLEGRNVGFDANYAWLFSGIFAQAQVLSEKQITEVSVFMFFANSLWREALVSLGVQDSEVGSLQMWLESRQRKQNYEELWEHKSILKPKGTVNRAYTSRYTPTLNQFAADYTAQAANGKFVLSIGKEQAMIDTLKVLQKDNNCAVMLIGEPGVGKSQFLRHLAVRMVVEDVPLALRDKRLVVFDFSKAFTQNQSLENFKITLEQVLEEVAASRDIVLVLEDMDQLLNVRKDLQAEIANLLVKGLDRNNVKIIGTAATDGYQRYVKPVRTLAAAMTPVTIPEPEPLVSLQILIDVAQDYERKLGIKVQIDSLRQIVSLAPRFAYERVMPDKGIDLLEEAVMEAQEQGLRYVTSDLISNLVSRKVGVEVGEISGDEAQKLVKLEETMHLRVVGQDQAIRAIAAALRRSRAGLSGGNRPVASFLFYGPTGVGKTEVAKTLASSYYGSDKMMIRVDMSEYQEEKNLDRLIGHMEGEKFINGYLTEAVRARPFSLVLVDEVEKANPKVLDLFLQILDEGHLTDGGGRKVDFTNTIIIATSNAGSREIAERVGEGMGYDAVYQQSLPALKQVFRVELLNRFDKIIMFKPLLPHEVEQIADRMMSELNERLLERGMSLKYSPQVLSELVKMGYNPVYGAREIRRVIQEQIEDRIAEAVVKGELISGKGMEFSSISSYKLR